MQFKELVTEYDIRQLLLWHTVNTGYCVFDFETTGLDTRKAQVLDIQAMGQSEEEAVIFSGKFLHLLDEFHGIHVYHNFKYDWAVAYSNGVDFRRHRILDTMLLHHLLDENLPHDLDSIIQGRYHDDYKAVFWGANSDYQTAPRSQQIDYACRDVVYTRKLFTELESELRTVPEELIDHVHDLARTLFNTEIEGVNVNLDYLHNKGIELQGRILDLRKQLRAAVNLECDAIELDMWGVELDKRKTDKGKANVKRPEFSFDSNKQLQTLLYTHLKLPVQKNEKTKQITTDDMALSKLEAEHPLVSLLREYREHQKIYGTYIEGILERAEDGVIYPSFNVNGTTTGRISHSNPNMGNMPRAGGIRAMFVPRPGHRFISCDYAQLEVCIGAHYSQDPNLLKIVLEGASQHDITSQSLNIPRQAAKNLNFAMQYNCSHFKVAKMMGVSIEEGQVVWTKYWKTYSGLRRIMDECNRKVDAGIPIINPFGRRRHFEAGKRPIWAKEYRQAFNALIQGTGADICNKALYLVDNTLRANDWGRALFSVHDELLIEVKESRVLDARRLLADTMIRVGAELKLTVPLKVDCSEGMTSWED